VAGRVITLPDTVGTATITVMGTIAITAVDTAGKKIKSNRESYPPWVAFPFVHFSGSDTVKKTFGFTQCRILASSIIPNTFVAFVFSDLKTL